MAFVVANRVKETSVTAGTGALTLDGNVTGYQTFNAGISNSNSTYYTIEDPIAGTWEVGIGTYSTGGSGTGSLSRDTVLASSNAGSLVSFAANTKFVFVDFPSNAAFFNSQAYAWFNS
jgi:hypothetical protein